MKQFIKTASLAGAVAVAAAFAIPASAATVTLQSLTPKSGSNVSIVAVCEVPQKDAALTSQPRFETSLIDEAGATSGTSGIVIALVTRASDFSFHRSVERQLEFGYGRFAFSPVNEILARNSELRRHRRPLPLSSCVLRGIEAGQQTLSCLPPEHIAPAAALSDRYYLPVGSVNLAPELHDAAADQRKYGVRRSFDGFDGIRIDHEKLAVQACESDHI